WGFYVRHARNIIFENIKLVAAKKDYRRPIVLDDVHNMRIKGLQVQEPGPKKDPVYIHKSTDIKVEK
ncbi:MAG: glycoside hydrolase, partial [Candidatus Saccharicenans sp.]